MRMEMDFMGLSGSSSTSEIDKNWNRQGPDDESGKTLGFSLFQGAHKTSPGSGLQPFSKICDIEDGDQVSLNLGTSGSLRRNVVKVGNVTRSAGKRSFSAYDPEKKHPLSRFHNLAKENIRYRSDILPFTGKTKAVTVLKTGMRPDNLAELDIQPQKPPKDKVPAPNMTIERLNWTKATALQQLASVKNEQEERPAKRKFESLVTSSPKSIPHGDAFESNKRSTIASQVASKVPGKLGNAQLTIFYAGDVNVYDDVSPEKAHKIMLLAGSVNSGFATGTDSYPQRLTPLAIDGHRRPATPTMHPSLPNALTSITSQTTSENCNLCVAQLHSPNSQLSSKPGRPTGSFLGDEEFQTNNRIGDISSQQNPEKQLSPRASSNVMKRALPQARKASLSRFLENRQGRVLPNWANAVDSPDGSSSMIEKSFSSSPHVDICPTQTKLKSDAWDVRSLLNKA